MANVIRIKRSTSAAAPSSLAQGEPAYVEQQGSGDGRLYIGVGGPAIEEVGGKYYVDLLNSYDVDLPNLSITGSPSIAGANTGDVTLAGTPDYITISNQVLTLLQIDLTADVAGDLPFSNIAQMATNSFLARDTAATGDIEVLSATEATALLDLATISVKGLLPTLSNVATQYLNGVGAWAVPAGGGDVAWNAGTAPADHALVRFDGVTGQVIQESAIIVDDSENVTGMGTLNGKTIADLVSIDDTLNVGTWTWVLDEDNLGTDSNVHLATQQSIKKYVDDAVVGGVSYIGGWNAATNTPNLNTKSDTEIGDMYTVTAAGTTPFTTGPNVAVEIGDVLISEVAGTANDIADWTIVQNNLDEASTTVPGYVSISAQAFGGTKTFDDISGADVGAVLDSFVIDGGSF